MICELADLALAQLPKAAREQPVLVRSDSAGASHELVGHLRERGAGFSVGFDLDERVRAAILATPEAAWQPAIDADGARREGAEVVELTGRVNLARWPEGTRLICRWEDPHPGAQLSFSDAEGHRFQAFITDQPDPDITAVELRHRQYARVEQRIRGAKATGLRNLPFDRFRRNAVWVELVLLALELAAWAGAAAGRRATRGRAEGAALPAVAPGRPARPPRPTGRGAPATLLAMGGCTVGGVRPPARAAAAPLTGDRRRDRSAWMSGLGKRAQCPRHRARRPTKPAAEGRDD